MKNLALILAALMLSSTAFARSDEYYATDPNATPSPTPAPATPFPTPFPVATPAPAPVPTPTPVITGSINPAANQGQQSQSGGAGANAAAGAALIAAGMALMANPPTQPAGAALIAMGMLALAQSGHDSNAAGQSANTAAASYDSVGTNQVTANPELGNGTSGYANNPALKDGKAALQNAGYGLSSAGLVTPDGTTIPNSAFNSASGMAAAGLSPDAIKQVQDALATVNADAGKHAKVSGVALAEGGGSGGAGSSTGGSDFSFTMPKSSANAFALSDAAKRAMIAGKTVNFDGDPIGVRGNNIFDMIHTAYQKKRERNDFIGDEVASGPNVRAPASVAPVKAASSPAPKAAAASKAKRPQINNR